MAMAHPRHPRHPHPQNRASARFALSLLDANSHRSHPSPCAAHLESRPVHSVGVAGNRQGGSCRRVSPFRPRRQEHMSRERRLRPSTWLRPAPRFAEGRGETGMPLPAPPASAIVCRRVPSRCISLAYSSSLDMSQLRSLMLADGPTRIEWRIPVEVRPTKSPDRARSPRGPARLSADGAGPLWRVTAAALVPRRHWARPEWLAADVGIAARSGHRNRDSRLDTSGLVRSAARRDTDLARPGSRPTKRHR
jgi:hypothetical protein